jgi:hypothetical protein
VKPGEKKKASSSEQKVARIESLKRGMPETESLFAEVGGQLDDSEASNYNRLSAHIFLQKKLKPHLGCCENYQAPCFGL